VHAPIEPALRVESRPLTELAAFVDEWRALATQALQPNIFYQAEFALAAAPVFGRGVAAVLVWSAAGRLLGFFPSRTESRRYGVLAARVGWTHPYAPLGVPLVDRENATAVIAAWLDHLGRDPKGPRLLLLPMLSEGRFAAALHSVLSENASRSAAFDRRRRALLAPGNERADYLQRAGSPKRRKEIRRLRHRLEDLGPVSHVAATSPDEIAAAMDEFLRLEASGWKGAVGTAAALKPEISRFLEAAVSALAASGKARADLLLVGDRPIAAAITLLSGDTAWCWKIAYDESFARYSPGLQLLLELSGDLLAIDSLAQADSCAVPDHPMIDPIWRERLVLADLLIGVNPQSRLAFGLACGAETARRSMLAGAKAVLHRLRASGA
jgi:CelD/BcsL family acetyltransferase involved in cellulose biosynthesis